MGDPWGNFWGSYVGDTHGSKKQIRLHMRVCVSVPPGSTYDPPWDSNGSGHTTFPCGIVRGWMARGDPLEISGTSTNINRPRITTNFMGGIFLGRSMGGLWGGPGGAWGGSLEGIPGGDPWGTPGGAPLGGSLGASPMGGSLVVFLGGGGVPWRDPWGDPGGDFWVGFLRGTS